MDKLEIDEWEFKKLTQRIYANGWNWFLKNYKIKKRCPEFIFQLDGDGSITQFSDMGHKIKSISYNAELLQGRIRISPNSKILLNLIILKDTEDKAYSALREFKVSSKDFYKVTDWENPRIMNMSNFLISFDNISVFTGHKDGVVRKWCQRTRKLLEEYRLNNANPICEYRFCFSTDNQALMFHVRDSTKNFIRICSPKDLHIINDIHIEPCELKDIEFLIPISPTSVIIADDDSVKKCTFRITDQQYESFQGLKQQLDLILFGPDKKTIWCTFTNHRNVNKPFTERDQCVWSVKDNTFINRYYVANEGRCIQSILFSTNGKLLYIITCLVIRQPHADTKYMDHKLDIFNIKPKKLQRQVGFDVKKDVDILRRLVNYSYSTSFW